MLCQHVAEEDLFSAAAMLQEMELAGRLGDDEASVGEDSTQSADDLPVGA
jgi:hypothetical protein